MILLRAEGIRKIFWNPQEIQVLKGCSLTVNRGESVAIIGRSGEGKSTLLHILGTLARPCSGEIEFNGRALNQTDPAAFRNRHLGFIFQSFHLLLDYTALENVLFPAKIARKQTRKGSIFYKRAQSLLASVGLEDRMHHPTKHLSGGEKQRVAIARALCNEPDLVLADEPSGNLDRETSQGIHKILLNCSKEQGNGLLIVTHNLELAEQCDTVYALEEGILHAR